MISCNASAIAAASDSVVFTEVTKGSEGLVTVSSSIRYRLAAAGRKLPEKSPGHVVDRADVNAPIAKTFETSDMPSGRDDGGKEGLAARNPRQRQSRDNQLGRRAGGR
jgi:hypothetical protein